MKRGLNSEKARKILKEGKAHGKPLTDAQKRFFGLIAGSDYAKGGDVPKLRSVSVFYDNGDVVHTAMSSDLSDKEIRKYFAVGRVFNIGSGEKDLMAAVDKVVINDDMPANTHYAKKEVDKLFEGNKEYAEGGQVDVKILNEGKRFTPRMYKAIMADYDKDKLPNADDPRPQIAGDTESIEGVRFAQTFGKILDLKRVMDKNLEKTIIPKLKEITPDGSTIYARTKTPYSILKKLVEKRMLDAGNPKRGLTDIVGTTIVVDDKKELNQVRNAIEGLSGDSGVLGRLIEVEDMYDRPKGGYRAIHYLFWSDDSDNKFPVELQLKTKRMKALNELSHPAYKEGKLNSKRLMFLTDLANKADMGDEQAAETLDELMTDKEKLQESLYVGKAKSFERGGLLDEFEITTASEDLRDIYGD